MRYSQDSKSRNTFACATEIFLTHFIISIAVLENVPLDAELQKRVTFSTLNVGLAGSLLMVQYLKDTCVKFVFLPDYLFPQNPDKQAIVLLL
jgi:hypothetical protein